MNNRFDRTDEPCEQKIGNAGQFNDIDPFKDYRMALPAYNRPKVEHTALPDFQIVDSAADLNDKHHMQAHADRNSYGTKPPDDGPPNSKTGFSDKPHFSTKNVNSEVRLHHGGKYAATDTGYLTFSDSAVSRISPTTTGKALLESSFKNLDGFKPSGNDTVQLTKGDATHPTIAKMVLDRNHDKVPYRTELSANSKDQLLQFDHDYSIKFTNRLVDWKTDKSADAIFQLHAIPSDGQWTSVQNSKVTGLGGPEVMLRTANGEYQFYSGHKEIWHGKIEEGQWNDWEIKMRVDGTPGSSGKGKDGYLELYRNGKLLASADGANVAGVGAHGEPLQPAVYAKIGIYKWPWKDGRPATESSRREIDYANFSINELTPS